MNNGQLLLGECEVKRISFTFLTSQPKLNKPHLLKERKGGREGGREGWLGGRERQTDRQTDRQMGRQKNREVKIIMVCNQNSMSKTVLILQ